MRIELRREADSVIMLVHNHDELFGVVQARLSRACMET